MYAFEGTATSRYCNKCKNFTQNSHALETRARSPNLARALKGVSADLNRDDVASFLGRWHEAAGNYQALVEA